MDKLNESMIERNSENNKKLSFYKKELKRLENKRNKIEELFIDGSFLKERFDRKISEVEEEIFHKKIELDELEIANTDYKSLIEYSRTLLKSFSTFWLNYE